DLLGWPAGDVLGRPFADLLPVQPVPATEAGTGVGTGTTAGALVSAMLRPELLLHRDGHRVPVRTRFLPVGVAEPEMVLLAPADPPDLFQLPEAPAPDDARRGDTLAALDSERLPAHELPQRAAEACCDYLGGDVAYLMLLDDSGELRVAGYT